MSELPEERQAAALRDLEAAAERRTEAQRQVQEATAVVRAAVLAALAAGVTTRRAAEVGRVALDTVARWSREARAEGIAGHERQDHAIP